MTERERLETLVGNGRFRNDHGSALEVSYSISIWRELSRIRTADGESHVPGLQSIDGLVDGLDSTQRHSLMGKTLALELEDGRFLKCFLRDSHGRLTGSGGLRMPS